MNRTNLDARQEWLAQLRDFLEGFARGRSARLLALQGWPWGLAIQLEQLRRSRELLSLFDDALLAALAAGEISLEEEVKAAAQRGLAAEQGQSSPIEPAPAATVGEAPAVVLAMREAVERIAREVLQIQTLEAQNSDRLDFHEVSVWSVRDALGEAFIAGRSAGG